MVDLKTNSLFKVKEIEKENIDNILTSYLIDGENIELYLGNKSIKFIFTNHRIIIITYVGLTASKLDITSISYKKITAFSIETRGEILDKDALIEFDLENLGLLKLQITTDIDIRLISKIVSESLFN